MTKQITKNQHYIPKSLLVHFADSNERLFEALLVQNKKIFPTNISSTMCETHTYEHDKLPVNTIEKFFSKIEGEVSVGLYSVELDMTPIEVQSIINERFSDEILSHYSTSTREIVPINDALIIASLIQRETIGTDGMRLLSGIMWNRLFLGMKLQIDSTLQYAKANKSTETSWWPKVVPNDKYIVSPFNTYKHNGLPPSPIANPSVEAILAALNPIETSCLYYFNDKTGAFHCSDNYKDHVLQIKKYYSN